MASAKHGLFDNNSLPESLSLDFKSTDVVHQWHKMPECDEFVGTRRSKHTMVSFKDAVYVFGGDNGKSMLNDLLRFDIKEHAWVRAFSTGIPPAPRYHHSAVVYQESMYIFGGYTGDIHSNSNLANKNDLWEYSFTTGHWNEWRYLSGRKPVARSAHGAAIHDGVLTIFAGYDGNARLNDMWQIRLNNQVGNTGLGHTSLGWNEVIQVGECPPTCCNFPVAVCNDKMYVFSGQSGAKISNSIFEFCFKSHTWVRLTTEHVLRNTPLAPTRRYGHSMVAYECCLYVFGGAADINLPNDLHCFDFVNKSWSLVPVVTDGDIPSGRLFHAASIVDDCMYVFGGTVDNNIRSGEMYRFRLAAFPRCTLTSDFGKLLDSQQFCDIFFVVGKNQEIIPAHIAMVVARSESLREIVRNAKLQRDMRIRQLFNVDTSEVDLSCVVSQKDMPMLEIYLDDVDPTAFKMLLDFIYTDSIDPTANRKELASTNQIVLIMMQVYTLSVRFRINHLEELCVHYLELAVNLVNVLVALQNASLLKLGFVKEYCLNFIVKESNYNHIVMSKEFEDLDPPLIVEIVRRHQSGPQPFIMDPQYDRISGFTLQTDMEIFLESSTRAEFSDVTLVLDGSNIEIPAHKAVLAARSGYFEAMFRSLCPPDNRVCISIGEVVPTSQSFDSLLRYIYCGKVLMPPEDALYLFAAPYFYIFTNNRLQAFCKNNLERNVTIDNVVQILEAADKSRTQEMKDYALNMIVEHYPSIWPQPRLQQLSRELLLEIMRSLANVRCPKENNRNMIRNDWSRFGLDPECPSLIGRRNI